MLSLVNLSFVWGLSRVPNNGPRKCISFPCRILSISGAISFTGLRKCPTGEPFSPQAHSKGSGPLLPSSCYNLHGSPAASRSQELPTIAQFTCILKPCIHLLWALLGGRLILKSGDFGLFVGSWADIPKPEAYDHRVVLWRLWAQFS